VTPVTIVISVILSGKSGAGTEPAKASGVRLNYKWLGRNFKKHIGISPKTIYCLAAFLNAYRGLDSFWISPKSWGIKKSGIYFSKSE
jgi:hypothetical protein